MPQAIHINLGQVLSSRLGSRSRWIPRPLVRWMEKTICQDQLNAMLRACHPQRGADFCRTVLEHLGIKVDLEGAENLPASPRALFVSNHPLGGLDGMALIDALTRHYGLAPQDVKFVVNDLLMAVEPLTGNFIAVNKHGAQSRRASADLNDALRGCDPVIVFPAGLVSRLQKDGTVADLEWRKSFVPWAIANNRPIVPMYFEGLNSRSFYTIARRRKALGLKFNYEMIYLPREIFRARGAHYRIRIGRPLSPADTAAIPGGAPGAAKHIRNTVYSLS